ncbi:class III extradiol dioxygenase subunit B-like domain-containing protein [Streptomyces sp. NPDC048057]|uniref:class III extradiol dioxygenase subunit B-like domain-containing protein n=1 Tax=Streptomyces sp. NPDC048057 TaxID=3155628 RepID=UPI0033D673BE
MLVAAAVCPCPPLLVPEVASGAAPELDAARDACARAVSALAAARPELLVVVGPTTAEAAGTYPSGTTGSFRGFGVGLDVRLGTATPATGRASLPPALAVGAWLLQAAEWATPVEGLGVDERATSERCFEEGRKIADRAERVALLAMGDASACRSLKAPGYLDERAADHDAAVARALAEADPAGLRALDASLAYELKAAGRPAWQVLAGAAEGAGLTGQMLYDDAPYGVGYFVASWTAP